MPPRLPARRTGLPSKTGKPGPTGKTGKLPAKGRAGSSSQGVLPRTQEEEKDAGGPSGAPRLKMPELLAELEEAAKQLGIRVTYENLAGELGSGGLCKVKGEWRAILDKRCTPGERVSILAMALTRFSLEGLTISQQVRELVEQAKQQAALLAAQEAGEEPGAEPGAATAPASEQGAASEDERDGSASTAEHDGLAQSGAPVVS